VRNEKHLG